jgi:hypothetical protein
MKQLFNPAYQFFKTLPSQSRNFQNPNLANRIFGELSHKWRLKTLDNIFF